MCAAGWSGEDCSYFLAGEDDDGAVAAEEMVSPAAQDNASHPLRLDRYPAESQRAAFLMPTAGARASEPAATVAATVTDSSCDPPCARDTGRCFNGRCFCAQGFAGTDCSQPVVQPQVDPPNVATALDAKALDLLERQVQILESQLSALGGPAAPAAPSVAPRPAVAASAPAAAASAGADLANATVATPWGRGSSPATAPPEHLQPALDHAAPPARAPRGQNFSVLAEAKDAAKARQAPVEVPRPPSATAICWEDCNGHGSCAKVGGDLVCQCEAGWIGAGCDMPACPNDCSGRGICAMSKCVCNEGFQGVSCENARCPDDCSGVGYCRLGVCHCSSGFGGPNCGKVASVGQTFVLKLKQANTLKVPKTMRGSLDTASLRDGEVHACPQNCNGRGACSTEGKCDCMAGYSGTACQDGCKNECSHQGDCVEGACLCFSRFLGEDCSNVACCSGHGSCDDPDTCVCEDGWGGHECSVKLLCADPKCSEHGACQMGTCVCDSGYGGPLCANLEGGCAPACGAAGMCNPETRQCDCSPGFTGETCETEIKQCPNFCSNKGLCMDGECMCGTGWSGADCSQRFFTPGGSSSDLKPPEGAIGIGAGGALSGHEDDGVPPKAAALLAIGKRGATRSSSKARSLLQQSAVEVLNSTSRRIPSGASSRSLAMPQIQEQENPIENIFAFGASVIGMPSAEEVAAQRTAGGGEVCGEGGLCSGNGVCNTAFGRCECNGLWYGVACETLGCPGLLETGKDCSGHGLCQGGNCMCAAGWGVLPGSNGSNMCADAVCPVPCSAHGYCDNGQCRCQQGWMGPTCGDPQCPANCNGKGVCGQPSPNSPGECTCDYGWAGSSCDRQAAYQAMNACPLDCSGNGLCLNGICTCNVGFSGSTCGDPDCAPGLTGPNCDVETCQNDCRGRGLCMMRECMCMTGFTGADCSMPSQCFEPCRFVCEGPSAAEEKCNYCVASCQTAMMNAPLGMHSPFDDLQATFMQVKHQSPNGSSPARLRGEQLAGKQHRHREVSAAVVPPQGRHHEVSAVRVDVPMRHDTL